MFKRVLIGGAVAASLFGVAGASASALTGNGPNNTVVQQSDKLTTTCANPGAQWGAVTDSKSGNLLAVRMYQQFFQGCAGDQAQAVAYGANGHVLGYSDINYLDASGLDTYLDFHGVNDQAVASIQLTVAAQIQNEGGTQGNYTSGNNYQTAPGVVNPADNHSAP